MSFSSTYFFDTSNYPHASLFKETILPWEVLTFLSEYLGSLQLGNIQGKVSPQAYLINPETISIGHGTIIEPGAYIHGPCWIGNHCVVRHGAYIRGNLLTGDDCVIGHGTEVKHAIFLNRVHAAHFSYIGDSILGNEVNLGAGTKCANFRLDKEAVFVSLPQGPHPTQMRKLGALIGDKTQIGCNCVTNPGTLIGREVSSYPCLNLRGFISSYSIVKPSVSPIIVDKSHKG